MHSFVAQYSKTSAGDWGGWVNSGKNRTFRCSTKRMRKQARLLRMRKQARLIRPPSPFRGLDHKGEERMRKQALFLTYLRGATQ